MEQQNRLFLINLIGVVLGAVVGIYLIPRYGLLG
nr:MAG TPA: YtxH-like protein [Caudoviricetes sp.]